MIVVIKLALYIYVHLHIYTEKTVWSSLTAAGLDVGDLRLCHFREFVDAPAHRCRREVETSWTLPTHPVDIGGPAMQRRTRL